MTATQNQLRARVVAKLNRPPRDCLESAVVLEAWGGVAPGVALRAGPLRGAPTATPQPDVLHAGRSVERSGHELLAQLLGIAVVTRLLWAAVDHFGVASVQTGWTASLPVILSSQWLFRRRYGATTEPTARIFAERRVVAAVLATAGLGNVVLAFWSSIAALCVSAGVVLLVALPLAWRRWTAAYAALLGCAVAYPAHGHLVWVATALALATSVLAAAALTTMPTPKMPLACRGWAQSLASGLVGAELGGLMAVVFGAGPTRASGATIAVFTGALIGSAWAGDRLSLLWFRLPEELESTNLLTAAGAASTRGIGQGVVTRTLAGAVLRLVAPTLFVCAAWWMLWAHDAADGRTVMWFGAELVIVAIVGLLVALLEGLGFGAWAMATALGCLASVLTLRYGWPAAETLVALLVGLVVAASIAATPLWRVVRDPARVFAQHP